ncbi:MAG: hypothetical protein FJ399_11860, partial [Verrucomicrobia bacterium]|nr:hypothetical protein [Verrucomicrobiota bacterium]
MRALLFSTRNHRRFLAHAIASLAFLAGFGTALAQEGKVPHSVSEKTSEALQKLRPLQEAQNFAAMLAILEAVPFVPNSYDEALILDMKGRIFAMTNQLTKAIAPWERAIELSDQFRYLPERQVMETVLLLAQLHGSEGSSSKVPAQQKLHLDKAVKY